MAGIKKIILAPDSFKGTMSSMKICNIMSNVIKRYYNDAQVLKIPVADGGEGTVECFLEAVGGKKVAVRVKGPYFEDIESFYGVLSDGETAVIEMAAAAGLPLVGGNRNPALTTTYGVGQLMAHAAENGCTRIIIGLGGSCTNDGGAGMAAALGVKFTDEGGNELIPTGGTLDRVARIDTSCILKTMKKCTVIAACDVENTLCGRHGAAQVFATQKGADRQMTELLDNNLLKFSEAIKRYTGMDIANIPGSGAAGGLGAGVIAFVGAELKRGIDIVLDTVGFDDIIRGTDLVLTGEGKIDGQSLMGKAVVGIARRAKLYGVPVLAIAGDIGDDVEALYSHGVSGIFSINRVAVPFEEAKLRCERDMEFTVDSIMRLIGITENKK